MYDLFAPVTKTKLKYKTKIAVKRLINPDKEPLKLQSGFDYSLPTQENSILPA